MTIVQKIREKIAAVEANQVVGQVGFQLQEEAIAAILGGLGSEAWTTYMKNFADTPEQLARLTAQDSAGNDPYVRKSLAYLVSDAVCGLDTISRLKDRLEDGLLDQGL